MARRKTPIRHADIVRAFAARLREVRHSRGLTQAELARRAQVTAAYVGRLESAGAAPGIDLVDRLAGALGTTVPDLLPPSPPPDTAAVTHDARSSGANRARDPGRTTSAACATDRGAKPNASSSATS